MKISVFMITYNQEEYVEQAVKSALNQKTSFDYEIVIGDDASNDQTRDIIIRLSREHPSRIRLLLADKNRGTNRNFVDTLTSCRGEYAAFLEGDDYWCKSDKLQKQADLLDKQPGLALCFHDVEAIYEDNERPASISTPPGAMEVYCLEDILKGNFISGCSMMFRRCLVGQFPNWFFSLPMGDWPLYVLLALRGNIGHIGEVMGVYRIHQGGVWSGKKGIPLLQGHIEFYRSVKAVLDRKSIRIVDLQLAKRYFYLSQCYLEQRKRRKALRALGKSLFISPLSSSLYSREFFALVKRLALPFVR